MKPEPVDFTKEFAHTRSGGFARSCGRDGLPPAVALTPSAATEARLMRPAAALTELVLQSLEWVV